MIIGSVYNAANMPPFPLPQASLFGGLKSSTCAVKPTKTSMALSSSTFKATRSGHSLGATHDLNIRTRQSVPCRPAQDRTGRRCFHEYGRFPARRRWQWRQPQVRLASAPVPVARGRPELSHGVWREPPGRHAPQSSASGRLQSPDLYPPGLWRACQAFPVAS